jgi:hypothetical protein
MNQKENDNLHLAINEYKHVCISINLYSEFLNNEVWPEIEPFTEKQTLMTGLYARIRGSNIWVSKLAYYQNRADGPQHIRVSNNEIVSVKKSGEGWSPLFILEEFDKFHELRAFW